MYHGGLKKRWKYQITTRMKSTHREGQWRFPKSKDFLKQYPCFASMLNKRRHLTCYAHIGACLLDPPSETGANFNIFLIQQGKTQLFQHSIIPQALHINKTTYKYS
jgi:hypothetical protein